MLIPHVQKTVPPIVEQAEHAYIQFLMQPDSVLRLQSQRVMTALREFIAVSTGRSEQEVEKIFSMLAREFQQNMAKLEPY